MKKFFQFLRGKLFHRIHCADCKGYYTCVLDGEWGDFELYTCAACGSPTSKKI